MAQDNQQTHKTHQEDATHRQRLQWFFTIALSIWTLAAIVAIIVAFCLTKNPLSLSLFSTLLPPTYLWYRFVKYLFPMDDKWFELERRKIQVRTTDPTKGDYM